MDKGELRQSLERALSHVFRSPENIIGTFTNVFTDFPKDELEKISDSKKIEGICAEIAGRKDVQEMQKWISLEVSAGRETLETIISAIFLQRLPSIRTIPQDQLNNFSENSYNEWWVVEEGTDNRLAMAHLPSTVAQGDVLGRF